jgi:Double zinc ribbon
MTCPGCQQENPAQARFCMKCGTGLTLACAKCNTELPEGAAFCFACGQPVTSAPSRQRFTAPDAYTPRHLAEKILTSKAALEGERKQVTVLFADLKGSMELLADRDPEEARKLLDPVLERMMEAVHRYEGTVNQVMGHPRRAHRWTAAPVEIRGCTHHRQRVLDTGADVYSITSSARGRSDCGILSPRTFAVLRLMTSSNLVGCSTGRSAGFTPLPESDGYWGRRQDSRSAGRSTRPRA